MDFICAKNLIRFRKMAKKIISIKKKIEKSFVKLR